MKLLCICPIGIGNYLLFYPACKLLKDFRPETELHLLALRKQIADFAEGDPLWERVHIIDPTRERSPGKIASFIWGLRRERFHTSLSFFPSNTWQYNLLPNLCGIPERFAVRYPMKRFQSLSFLNNRLVPIDTSLHDLYQNVNLAGFFLHKDLHKTQLHFPVLCTGAEHQRANEILQSSLPVRIAVHPGSSIEHGMDAKRWAPQKFGALADRICEVLGAEALIFGGPDELQIKEKVASVMKQPHRIMEPLHLQMTAALMKACKLCLCNDSGLMHIAACSGVPVIALFGPTDERRNGPVGSGHLVIRKEMPGFPLWTARNVGARAVPRGVDPQESLNALSVDGAWERVKPWLQGLSLARTSIS